MAVKTAVVLVRADDSHFMSQEAGVFVEAIRRELGDVNVLVGFIPAREPVAYLKEMFRTLMSAGQVASVVAISCPREVYCYLATLDVPFAIGGSVYADSDVIPSVDADNREAGLLLTKHLLKKGCRRIILLSTMEGLPGEHDFHDGTSQALVEMNLPPTTLLVCAYPSGHQELLAFLRHLMHSNNPPDAFICHGAYMAEQVRLALEELALDQAKQPEIVYDGPPLASGSPNHQVYAATQKGFTQIAQMIAALLGKIGRGEPLSEQRVIIPVELYGISQIHTTARRVRS
ncbi:MAG TPA: substrate-binding domain-containing protein [Tepidisphaeraceae bacterium]|nr:substrate-binding domain-containing protein [Tepidisphaeraceae bacterium]